MCDDLVCGSVLFHKPLYWQDVVSDLLTRAREIDTQLIDTYMLLDDASRTVDNATVAYNVVSLFTSNFL